MSLDTSVGSYIYQYWLDNYVTINYQEIDKFAEDMEVDVEYAYYLLDKSKDEWEVLYD